MKVVVIGWDGATWDLLMPLIEKGHLPNIQKVMRNGVWGNLRSSVPPITGPAWVSFATGKNPGKHGCYDFSLPGTDLSQTKTIDTTKIRSRTFYEELFKMKKRCILINLPVSHPPRIDKVVITSFLTKGENFVYPRSLLDKIAELKDYRVTPDFTLMKKNIQDYIDDLRSIERNRFECMKKLFDLDWDFFFVLFSATDWIQHRMYGELLSDDRNNAKRLYEEIDEYIGWLLDHLPKKTTTFLMSDHGFSYYTRAFSINGWLRREGFLRIRKSSEAYSDPQKIGKMTEAKEKKGFGLKLPIPPWLLNNRILGNLAGFFSRFLQKKIKKIVPIDFAQKFQIDIPRTKAYCLSSSNSGAYGSIYINSKRRFANGTVDERDYEIMRNRIIERMQELRDDSGSKVFERILKKEDIYWGNELDKAPDIVFHTNEYVIFPWKLSTHNLTKGCSHNEHALNGIFAALGPDIKKNIKIENAEIIDIAPTILHLMDVPISKEIDGRVLKMIFKEGTEIAKRAR